MSKRVVVTGVGVVAPGSTGLREFENSLRDGKSALGKITRFESEGFSKDIVAEVNDFDPVDYMPVAVVRKTDRFAHLGIAASKMAVEDAGLSEGEQLRAGGVYIGSGLGGLNFHEQMMLSFLEHRTKKIAASSVPRITPNAVSAYIALQNKMIGPNMVISTACSSSAQAIGVAFEKIKSGELKTAIAGGAEATITPVNIAMYQAMMVLGSSTSDNVAEASRPFDLTRNGFVMGEGAAVLVMEDYEMAVSRGAKIYGEICGFGSNCGAYHMVSPNPSGEDAAAAMQSAIEQSGISASDVDVVYAHGTSTKLNDLSETRAIKIVFQEHAYKLAVSGIKSMIGHTIGSSGAIQMAAACISLESNLIPPTINLKNPDPECDLDYVSEGARSKQVDVIVSNSFGFGSNNAALVIRRMSK